MNPCKIPLSLKALCDGPWLTNIFAIIKGGGGCVGRSGRSKHSSNNAVFRLGCREQGGSCAPNRCIQAFISYSINSSSFPFSLPLKVSHAFMASSSLESKCLRGHSSPLSALLEDVDDYTSVYPPDLGLPISAIDWCTHRTESSHPRCCSVGPGPGENRPNIVSVVRHRDVALTFTGDVQPVLGTFSARIVYATPSVNNVDAPRNRHFPPVASLLDKALAAGTTWRPQKLRS